MAANHIGNIDRYNAKNINVDGVINTGRGWAKSLKHSTNFINKYRTQYGQDATVAYICLALQDGTIERNTEKDRRKIPKMHPFGMIMDRDIDSVFRAMIRRCYDLKDNSYPFYGGRGITVCGLWRKHPEEYEQWAKACGYKKGQTVHRIDSDKEYSPENCCFVDKSENSKWKRGTNMVTLNGITDSGLGWDRRLKLRSGYVNYEIRKYGMEETLQVLQSHMDDS